MKRRFALLGLAVGLGAAAAEDQYSLYETPQKGQQLHHKVSLTVSATLTQGKEPKPLRGAAMLQYPERVLEVGEDGMAKKVARYYAGARARFQIDGKEDEQSLRKEVRLMIGEAAAVRKVRLPAGKDDKAGQPKEDLVAGLLELWAPAGPMTADERALSEDFLDTTRIPALLPKEKVAKGAKWRIDPLATQRLCRFDSLLTAELDGTLTEISDAEASVKISGSAHGMELGAEVKVRVEAVLTFDRKAQLVKRLIWSQSDSRAESPVASAGVYQVKIDIERETVSSPELADEALAKVDLAAAPEAKMLFFQSEDGVYKFRHDRNWHLTAQQGKVVVMRRMVGNELLGQMTIGVLAAKPDLARIGQVEMERIVKEVNGLELSEIEYQPEARLAPGITGYVMTAKGKAGKLPIMQRHYLANGTAGKQVLVSFILEPVNAERFGATDQSVVGSLEFPTAAAASKGDAPPR